MKHRKNKKVLAIRTAVWYDYLVIMRRAFLCSFSDKWGKNV